MEILFRAGTVRSSLPLLRKGGSWCVCVCFLVVASGSSEKWAFKLPELCAKHLYYQVRDGQLESCRAFKSVVEG